MIWFSCGLCLVTIHWLTLLHAIWSRVISFLIMEWSPLGGSFPLGPVLGSLVKAPTLFGEARLNVLPFNPVIGYISCGVTSNMVCYVTWSSHYDSLVRILPFVWQISRRLISAMRCSVIGGDFPWCPGDSFSTSRIFSLNWVFIGFCFLFGPVFGLGMVVYQSNSLYVVCLICRWVLWIPRLGLSYHTRDFLR